MSNSAKTKRVTAARRRTDLSGRRVAMGEQLKRLFWIANRQRITLQWFPLRELAQRIVGKRSRMERMERITALDELQDVVYHLSRNAKASKSAPARRVSGIQGMSHRLGNVFVAPWGTKTQVSAAGIVLERRNAGEGQREYRIYMAENPPRYEWHALRKPMPRTRSKTPELFVGKNRDPLPVVSGRDENPASEQHGATVTTLTMREPTPTADVPPPVLAPSPSVEKPVEKLAEKLAEKPVATTQLAQAWDEVRAALELVKEASEQTLRDEVSRLRDEVSRLMADKEAAEMRLDAIKKLIAGE